MSKKTLPGPEYWDDIVGRMEKHYHIDSILCKHKKDSYLHLINRWTDVSRSKRLLKTDLFEEAVGEDDLLFNLSELATYVVGMDISLEAAARTKERAGRTGKSNIECVCCDVRQLPFESASFDLIISDSTLDHFKDKKDIYVSLEELWRILEPGGTLILTMDNKSNWSDPFFRLWIKANLAPYFSGHTYSIKEANKALREIGFDVSENTSVIHNPRLITRWIASFIGIISPAKSPTWIKKGLTELDKLETKRTRYLTGLYIAVKATKINKDSKN
jgi:ubiquinone/menaquinone biosynthesis C-methylase UbiE